MPVPGPQPINPEQLPSLLKPGTRVFMPGCSGQSLLVDEALRKAPGACAGVTFCGVFIPGINRTDYAALHSESRMEVIFMQPDFRTSHNAGRVDYLPLPYCNTDHYYRTGPQFDLAVVQVAPPDMDGNCSLGVAADFSPAALANCHRVLAHINPKMPRTRGPSLPLASIDYALEEPAPLLEIDNDGPVPDSIAAVCDQLAALIDDGATLQLGLGKMQQGLLQRLGNHRNLRLHSGMVSDPLLGLAESGALANQHDAVTCGVALGSRYLYDFCANDARVCFAPVAFTHQVETLRHIDRLACINSCIEVDLLGQVNGETINGRQVSGTGGLVDFGRGARLAPGGRYILATPATAKGGTVSRIVPQLAAHTPVSVARQDIDLVATEYGVADLRYKSVQQRAEALIAIAAPQFREPLAKQWRDGVAPRL